VYCTSIKTIIGYQTGGLIDNKNMLKYITSLRNLTIPRSTLYLWCRRTSVQRTVFKML